MNEQQNSLSPLSGIIAETDFKLDARNASALLKLLEKYSAKIPFENKSWHEFWFAALKHNSPQTVADNLYQIYQQQRFDGADLAVQQTFLLALLKLLETPRALINSLPARHRQLYYHDLLGLTARSSQPDSVVVNFTLQQGIHHYLLAAGTQLDAGQDSTGNRLIYAVDNEQVLSQQQLSSLFWIRRTNPTDSSNPWKVYSALNQKQRLALPEQGLRLFSEITTYTDAPESLAETSLYLGFSNTGPGDTLMLYWALDTPLPGKWQWFYYNAKQNWMPLIYTLRDNMQNPLNGPIWHIALPADIIPGGDNTNCAPEQYWLKAVPALSSTEQLLKMPYLKALFANAATATLATKADDNHFAQPLPAHTISQLVLPNAQISQVKQPLPAIGGRKAESQTEFLTRVAQRLLHRQRAVTWQDIRMLLTEHFPQILDMKYPEAEQLAHIPAPDSQNITLITSRRYSSNDDALRPQLSSNELKEMAQWLAQLMSLWANPQLKNPTYVDVSLAYRVLFNSGISEEYGYQQLAQLLRQHFMPWADDVQQKVVLGNKIDYYQLLATIQQSPLVKQVTQLVLKKTRDDNYVQEQSIFAQYNEVLVISTINVIPFVENVEITGLANIGQPLTVAYSLQPNNLNNITAKIQWYYLNKDNNNKEILISGATDKTWIVPDNYGDWQVLVKVTPLFENLKGTPVASSPILIENNEPISPVG